MLQPGVLLGARRNFCLCPQRLELGPVPGYVSQAHGLRHARLRVSYRLAKRACHSSWSSHSSSSFLEPSAEFVFTNLAEGLRRFISALSIRRCRSDLEGGGGGQARHQHLLPESLGRGITRHCTFMALGTLADRTVCCHATCHAPPAYATCHPAHTIHSMMHTVQHAMQHSARHTMQLS